MRQDDPDRVFSYAAWDGHEGSLHQWYGCSEHDAVGVRYNRLVRLPCACLCTRLSVSVPVPVSVCVCVYVYI